MIDWRRMKIALLLSWVAGLGAAQEPPAAGSPPASTPKSSAQEQPAVPASSLQHAILVSVNSRKITRHDLDDMGLLLFTVNFPDRRLDEVTEDELDQLSTTALRELIILNLIEDEVEKLNTDKEERNNIVVKDDEVMTNVKELGVEKHLALPLTLRFAKSQLVMNQFLGRTGTIFTPTPGIVRSFYTLHKDDVFTTERMVRVRHIFIPADTEGSSIAKKQAQMLYDELRKMPDDKRARMFPEMAKEFSQGRFKEDGGLINISEGGWFPQYHDFKMKDGTTFFPEGMLRAIRALSVVGDVQFSRSEAGWHILYLEEFKGGVTLPMTKVRKNIEDYLLQEAIDQGKIGWLDRKSQASNIIWHDGTPFPREKILLSMDAKQRLQFLRQRIHRLFDNSGKAAPTRPQSGGKDDFFGGKTSAKP